VHGVASARHAVYLDTIDVFFQGETLPPHGDDIDFVSHVHQFAGQPMHNPGSPSSERGELIA